MAFKKVLVRLVACAGLLNGDVKERDVLYVNESKDSFRKEVKVFDSDLNVKGIEIHRFLDKNRNGVYDMPQETLEVVRDKKNPHDLFVMKAFPDEGSIAVFVSRERYPNGILEFELQDSN